MAVIEASVQERIGFLKLNRPEKLNAFNAEMHEGLIEGIRAHEADRGVHCIVIFGEGRAFSSGGDMSGPGRAAVPDAHRYAYDDWQNTRASLLRWLIVWDCPKPIVAAVHGYCFGTSTLLAAMSDITVVAEDAKIAWPQLPVGGGMLAPVSQWLIGTKKARELSYMAGSSFSGIEAVALGWANVAVPEAEVLAKATEMARAIARTPSDVLAVKKRALNRAMDIQGFREAVQFGAEFEAVAHHTRGADFLATKRTELGLKETLAAFARGELIYEDEA